ncbi:MAG: PAS domain-containing protein [Peptococcaceae bacterium]|nr:PAS domain-containing protein [Peptococcaceae bacterium]
MDDFEALNRFPQIKKFFLETKLLKVLPGGFAIATDTSCQHMIHDPVASSFLQIEPWSCFSYTDPSSPVKAYSENQLLRLEETPFRRAIQSGGEIIGQEITFVWKNGLFQTLKYNVSPLYDENGQIFSALATLQNITPLSPQASAYASDPSPPTASVAESAAVLRLEKIPHEQDSPLFERRFQKAFQITPLPTFIIRARNKIVIDANQSFLDFSALKPEEATGLPFCELELFRDSHHFIIDLLQKQKTLRNVELETLHKTSFLLSAAAFMINRETYYLFTLNDITDFKKTQTDVSHLDRLNLIGQMAAGIGHEVRNPLTVVRGYLQMMGNKMDFISYRSIFDVMISELDRANTIISEFLSLAKDPPVKKTHQSLNDLLAKLFPLIEADAYSRNMQISFQPGDVPHVFIDVKEISQLILNLCHNGLEAMPIQGKLTIQTYSDSACVVLCVHNDGDLIPPEVLKKMGTPFFTTKQEGTGLGLAICYNIAHRHHGVLEIENNPQGTAFCLKLPL